jgi:hypothetical protein
MWAVRGERIVHISTGRRPPSGLKRQGFPGMPRAVLMQHHAGQRLALAPLAVRTAPALGLHLAGVLQHPLGPGVAHPEPVLAQQLLVEVLGVEVEVPGRVELDHPHRHVGRRTPARDPAQPTIRQPFRALRLIPTPVAQERPLRHPQNIRRLSAAQPATPIPFIDFPKAHLPYLAQRTPPVHLRPLLERL